MEKVLEYYNNVADGSDLDVKRLSRQIHIFGTIRLVIVLAAALTLILWPHPGWKISLLVVLVYAVPFGALMVRHGRLLRLRDHAAALGRLCRAELAGLQYDYSAFDGAADKMSADHPYSLDLDLFGDNSLFQSINRTVTDEGRGHLAGWFIDQITDRGEIVRRQQAVRELGGMTPFRQNFAVTGRLDKGDADDADLVGYLRSLPVEFAGRPFWRASVWAIPALWAVLIVLCSFGLISLLFPLLFFCVCMALESSQMKRVNKLHESVGRIDRIFKVYSRLIGMIEQAGFSSEWMCEQQRRFAGRGMAASDVIRALSRSLQALDQRGNMIVAVINIFTFRDIRISLRVERWKREHEVHVAEWLDALGAVDAMLSLGGFAFNHPGYVYPEPAEKYFVLEAAGMGHPLMNRKVCVHNDIAISRAPEFMIVTGANMAGKSTYLRTVGVNYLLACTGTPVCAQSFRFYPASLVTSLRTSDSLVANESYFYAELKRLKAMIDRLETGEELFIILDEILKGTNSDDKQKGSLALVRQFISYGTCGIIATHDLVLGTLAGEFPDHVRNFRFESEIEGDRLSFPYRMQPGVARNLNACFLMKRMGITV